MLDFITKIESRDDNLFEDVFKNGNVMLRFEVHMVKVLGYIVTKEMTDEEHIKAIWHWMGTNYKVLKTLKIVKIFTEDVYFEAGDMNDDFINIRTIGFMVGFIATKKKVKQQVSEEEFIKDVFNDEDRVEPEM